MNELMNVLNGPDFSFCLGRNCVTLLSTEKERNSETKED